MATEINRCGYCAGTGWTYRVRDDEQIQCPKCKGKTEFDYQLELARKIMEEDKEILKRLAE